MSMRAHKGGDTRSSRRPLREELPDPDLHPFDFPYNCGCGYSTHWSSMSYWSATMCCSTIMYQSSIAV